MKNEFLITINTLQIVEGEKEELEITTTASLEGDSDNYVIKYTEVDQEDKESHTTIKVEKGRCISVSREGEITTHMTIEKSVRHISHHVTPYGTFSLGVSAAVIDSAIDENGGTLHFRYTTDIEMNVVSEIDFNITLSKREDNKNVYYS